MCGCASTSSCSRLRYLEVLDSDTRMVSAELGVMQAELNELLAFVHIYRALGGGWQPEH
jgi:multidrug efflux system outer membrane protein